MLDNFRSWYYRYNSEITWFIIGWLSLSAIQDFSRGDWIGVIIDAF